VLADDLLLWMSAQREGSWSQFRNAVNRLQDKAEEFEDNGEGSPHTQEFEAPLKLPIHRILQLNLSMLGHAEFYREEGRYLWHIVPPFLAATESKESIRVVLCGARWPGFLEDMAEHAAHYTDMVTRGSPEGNAPEAVFVDFENWRAVSEFAQLGKFCVQKHTPMTLLSSVPKLTYPSLLKAKSLPYGPGWSIEHFDAVKLKWSRVSTKERDYPLQGLSKFSSQYAPAQYFITRRTWRKRNLVSYEVSPRIGKYLVLRNKKRSVIKYDSERESVILPAICRPPSLIERALVLCSGLLPPLDRGHYDLVYAGVPPEVARTVGKLLEQELLS
jgi:hypothetical protein